MQPTSGLVGIHRGDEEYFVLPFTPGLAATKLATRKDIIDLNPPVQLPWGLILRHRLHNPVLEPPTRSVSGGSRLLEFQRRNTVLGLREEVHRHGPRLQ